MKNTEVCLIMQIYSLNLSIRFEQIFWVCKALDLNLTEFVKYRKNHTKIFEYSKIDRMLVLRYNHSDLLYWINFYLFSFIFFLFFFSDVYFFMSPFIFRLQTKHARWKNHLLHLFRPINIWTATKYFELHSGFFSGKSKRSKII